MTDDLSNSLLIEEYKFCRELTLKNIDIIDRTETYGVFAMAVSAGFSIVQQNPLVSGITSFVPFLIAIFGLLRYRAIDGTLHVINDYLVQLETDETGIGYTQFFRRNKNYSLGLSRCWIWILLILLGITLFGLTVIRGPLTLTQGNAHITKSAC